MRKLLLLVSAFILFTQISWIFADNRLREQEPWEILTMPNFSLPDLNEPSKLVNQDDIKKQDIRVINFFASWCGPCKIEHPLLIELAERDVKIVGIDYRDRPERAKQFLTTKGNPFSLVLTDQKAVSGKDWGFSSIPQTYVINDQGQVLFHQVGRLNPDIIEQSILPLLEQ